MSIFRGELAYQESINGIPIPLHIGIIAPVLFYSAAGTPLPDASSNLNGATAFVSDALLPTYLGLYVSGGTITARVLCDGTKWVTA